VEAGSHPFSGHHVTVSVRDMEASIAFYSLLGFRPVLRWTSQAGELRLAHLALGELLLELAAFETNASAERLDLAVGNDVSQLGVRHFGLRVEDLAGARSLLLEHGCEVTEIGTGRTMIDFFYVKDPDGNWVEIVRDQRSLSPDDVIEIVEKGS
jgi:catechol 2,3-dioxygenase-like lactoylglutathione lyase family enzyme